MFNLLKTIFKYHRGAVSAVALLHIFVFIPASMVFWFEKQEQLHILYYTLIAAVAVITSWIFAWITGDIKQSTKHFIFKMEIIFAILAALAAPFLLTFYFETAVFFSNFFEEVYSFEYFGPNRALSAAIIFVFYNLFFSKDLIASVRGLMRKNISSQK